ncbi:MAG: CoA-acylating methylmalonate-semialdehyde dehydrogenase [Alphaproteobacteria bacterium]|nr:CoA-acylating methylmalonate-semialdehyde dehydrogenase [Alphaproteobacteria bacterium]
MATEVRTLQNYINGEFSVPEGCDWIEVENPSTTEIIARAPLSSRAVTEDAIAAAKAAYPQWARTPADRRVLPLFNLRSLMVENMEMLSRLISEEMGKSVPDAQAEMKRALENIEVGCGMPVLQQGDKMIGASWDIDGEVLKLPMGVFGMIAPFNFPGMIPFWFLPYAVASGNTYVVKPSSQVPCTMAKIAELIHEAGFPKGVINIVTGSRDVSNAMLESDDIVGISMVGSTRFCEELAQRCAKVNKRFQAMGSAKNHLVVMPDAKMDDVVRNMITSGYGCAGQRCMASSVIVAVGEETYRKTIDMFVEASKNVIVADPLDPKVAGEGVVVGPVITKKAKEFIEGMIQTGVDEGANLVLDGRGIKVEGSEKGYFVGPTVFTDVKPGMEIHKIEIFGPVQCIMKVETLDEAIELLNSHLYGNGASIYTQNGWWARRFKLEVECGMIGVNVGIPAPVAFLPFGGMKASQWADIKAQGRKVVDFFTQDKVITERYWRED